jgi:hypothetical protein
MCHTNRIGGHVRTGNLVGVVSICGRCHRLSGRLWSQGGSCMAGWAGEEESGQKVVVERVQVVYVLTVVNKWLLL